MKQSKQNIGVFIISPNDVKEERDIVRKVCKSFNDRMNLPFTVEPIAWEDYPFQYEKNPQQNIDPYLDKADIFIVILWRRLGTEVEGYNGAVTGEMNVTGTQYEIEKILSMGKKDLFFYMKNKKRFFAEDELEEAFDQKRKLKNFLQKMEIQPGSTKRSYHTFETTEAFEKILRKHLVKTLYRLTGVKVPLAQEKRNGGRFLGYFVGLVILMMMVWMMQQQFNKEETAAFSSLSPRIDEKGNKQHTEMKKKSLYIEAENFTLPIRMIPDIAVITNENRATYVLQVSYSETLQDNTIANQKMVTVHCFVSYDLQDKNRGKRIQTGMFDAEAIDFDVKSARYKCKKKAQYEMALQIKSVLKEII